MWYHTAAEALCFVGFFQVKREGAHVPVGISALACVSSGGDEDVMLRPEGNLECRPH